MVEYYYRKFKENDDYIIIGSRADLLEMMIDGAFKNNEAAESMLRSMFYHLQFFEQEQKMGRIVLDIVIRKDSDLGTYIINNPEIFIDYDSYISYDKVVGAYLVAAYQENNKMDNKIFPIFKRQQEGMKSELLKEYNEVVLDYILENYDYYAYLDKVNGINKDNKKYVVYENDTYSIRSFEQEKGAVKVKNTKTN